MPEYNLGRAHGEVVIDTNTKGIKKGEQNLDSFEKSVEDLRKSIEDLNKNLKDYDKELNDTARASDKHSKATKKIVVEQKEVTKHTSESSRSLRTYGHDLQDVVRYSILAAKYTQQFQKNFQNFNKTINTINAVQSFTGLTRATKELVNWQNILKKTIAEGTVGYLSLGRTFADLNDKEKEYIKLGRQIIAGTAGVAVAHKVLSGTLGTTIARLNVLGNGSGPLASTVRNMLLLGKRVDSNIGPLKKFYKEFIGGAEGLNVATRGLIRGFLGLKIAQQGYSGIRKFFGLDASGKLQAAIAGVLLTFKAIPAAAELGAKAVIGFANTLKAAGTLAGGLTAIPGIYATIAAAVVPVISSVKALGKTFGDVFKAKDADELNKALAELPKELQPAGKALAEIKKTFDDIQAAGTASFLGEDFAAEIDAINAAFGDPLKKNFQIINNAARVFRQELVGVASDGKNVTGLNQVFQSSKTVIDNLRQSIAPMASAMRDLIVVGSQFFADYSTGADTAAKRFAAWMASMRESGKLRKMMDDALAGAKDLARGFLDLGRATASFFGAFSTMNGTQALQSFADTMARWNKEAKSSALDGWINKMGRAVKGAGMDKFHEYVDMLKQFKRPLEDLYKSAKPFFDAISSGFQGTFIPMLKAAMQALESFLNAFAPFAGIIGQELAIAAGFKAINFALKPIANMVRVIGGSLAVLSGARGFAGLKKVLDSDLVMNFLHGLEKIPGVGSKASAALDKVQGAATKLGGALRALGPIAAAAAVAFFALTERWAAEKKVADFNKILEEGKQALVDYKGALKDAFSADGGVVGKNVLDTVSRQMSDMRAQLDKEAGEVPGVWDNIRDSLFGNKITNADRSGGIGALFNQTDAFNNLQKASQDAEHAKKQFDELGISSEDLGKVITGTDSAFGNFVRTMRASNKNEAADQLEQQRTVFKQMQDDFAKAGPGNVALANAIKQIGDAGSDAASKLQGLKAALKALGLDKTTEIENSLAYSDAIRKLGDEANNLVDQSAGLDKVFGSNGALNTTDGGANVNNLVAAISEAVTGFQQAVVDGKDLNTEWNRLSDALPKLAQSFTPVNGNVKETEANIRNLVTEMGGIPDVVSILLSVKGGDKLQEDIAKILATVGAGQKGEISIPITGDPKNLQTVLDSVLGGGKAHVGNNVITFNSAEISPQAWDALRAKLSNPGTTIEPLPVGVQPTISQGQQSPGNNPLENLLGGGIPKPVEVPVQPKVVPPATGSKSPIDDILSGDSGAAAPPIPVPIAPTPATTTPEQPAAAMAPKPAAPAVDTKELDAAKAKIDELQNKIAELNANPPKVEVKPEQFEALKQGTETAIQAFENLKTQIQAKLGEAQNIISAWGAGIQSTFAGVAASAQSYGVMIGNSFAAGLSSMSGVVALAAQRLAQSVNDNLKPGSPTKKGPLSGKGWVGYSGTKTGQAYGDALAGTAGYVGQSAGTVAGSVADGLGGLAGGGQGPYELGKLLGLFNDIFGIGSKIVDAFSQVADTIFQTMKLVSDPLGKGTFFGQSPAAAFGWKRDKNVSDADLAQKRADKIQSELGSESKKQTDQEKAAADQQKKDAEKQAQVTGDLIDAVSKGERVAPVTDAEKKTQSDAKKDATTQAKADVKAAGTTSPTVQNQPLTDEQANLNARRVASALGDKLDALSPEDRALVENGTVSVKTQDQMLAELTKQTPLLQNAIDISKKDNATQDESLSALQTVTQLIDSQGEATTPAAKQQKQALESLQGTIAGNAGLAVGENPIDQAAGIAGNAANVAKDVFASIQSVMDSIGAANELGDMFVRGLSNTEDVMKAIDQVQVFLQTAGQIASAVSSGLGVAAGIAGAAGSDPSGGGAAAAGALSGASQIASLVSAAFSTINGVIDLGQEVYRIAGKYVGQFAGFLVGGGNGPLMGDVKFLLDTVDGSLKTWSQDNPEDKRVFDNPFQRGGIRDQQPKIGQISVFGGPAQDPREMTNEMMFAVSAAGSGIWSNDY